MKTYPYYLANQPETPNDSLEVADKYSGELAPRRLNGALRLPFKLPSPCDGCRPTIDRPC